MRRWLGLIWIYTLVSATNAHGQYGSSEVVLDLSDHRISITSSFTGTSLLLFGAIKSNFRNVDMIVVVRGPNEEVIARKKERVGGIWINKDYVTFDNAPGFYTVFSTKPLEAITSQRILRRHRIGLGYINPRVTSMSRNFSQKELIYFRESLLRNRRRFALYGERHDAISIIGNALFRSEIYFPAKVPTGAYTAEVYLVHNKQIISAQTTPLFVNKSGIERAIFNFANTQPIWYGVLAIVGANLIGLGAAQLFRKT